MTDATPPAPIAVTPDRHAGRFWRRFTSYAFARRWRSVDVVMAELDQTASAFPIVFQKMARQEIAPVALLRLGASGTTPFVTADGLWRGTYVPSAVRAHPFTARPGAQNGEVVLMVDEATGLVTDDPSDEPFFAEGAPAPPLEQVLAFFRARATSAQRTRHACAMLEAQGVLSPLSPLPGMSEGAAAGLLAVDTARLDALDGSHLRALWRSGALRLAEAHRISLQHAAWMARAVQAAAARAPGQPAPADDGLSAFLAALSDDRARGRP